MLSRRFWLVSGQEVFKECTNHCMISKKNKAAPAPQLMVPLLQIRLKFSIRAFSNVGNDWAVFDNTWMRKNSKHRCLCFFTCVSSRAVYFGDEDVRVGYNNIFCSPFWWCLCDDKVSYMNSV